MADEIKLRNGPVGERNENPETPRKLQQENSIHSERRLGAWLFRAVAPLVAGLAFGCGSPSSYEQDADTDTIDENEAAEIEQDSDNVREDADVVQEDAETSDVRDVVDDAPVEVEDGGPDEADVPDVEEADSDVSEDAEPEAEDEVATDAEVPDGEETEAPDSDVGEAEGDAYDCTEDVRTIEAPTVLPDPVCGGTQTVSDIDTVIEWIGADCESTGTTTTRTAKILTLTPALDTANLGCARCRTTSTVAGDEVLVTVTATSLETAHGIACADITVGDNLDGGATEDKFRLIDVRADQAVGTLFDSTWRLLHSVRVYPTGAPTTIDSTRGVIAADFNTSAATARVCIIELPTIVRNNGDVETWASYGDFTFNTNVSGTSMQGWEWAR